MKPGPLRIVADSTYIPPAPVPPILASDNSPWEGLRLELHDVPAGAMPDHVRFDRHIIHTDCGDGPYCKYWRENGRERYVTVCPREVAMLSPNQELVGNRWDAPCRLLVVGIDPDRLNEVLGDELAGRPAEFSGIPTTSDDILRRMLHRLRSEVEWGYPEGRLFGESMLVSLAAYTLPRYGVSKPVLKSYRRGLSTPRLRRVLEYIDTSIADELGLVDLATVAGLSSYHFGKLFKLSMGQSVHQYVLDRRMQCASQLLAREKLSLSAVGAQVGLSNPSHFSAAFHRKLGMSPRAYRNMFKSRSSGNSTSLVLQSF
jgi:AraC family transcriptional regulator